MPAQAADGLGESCERLRGAKRCAYWAIGGGSGDDRVPYATTSIWVTLDRSTGSGVRGYSAVHSANAGDCGDLEKGTYRSRGKVSWTSEGVRYKRWITGTPVKKRALC